MVHLSFPGTSVTFILTALSVFIMKKVTLKESNDDCTGMNYEDGVQQQGSYFSQKEHQSSIALTSAPAVCQYEADLGTEFQHIAFPQRLLCLSSDGMDMWCFH